MKIFDWLSSFFKPKSSPIRFDTYRDTYDKISIEAFALFTVIDLIAGIISKCEFKTYLVGKEVKGMEWASLNFSPNINQSASEFWQEVICKLLYYKEVLIFPVRNQKIIADTYNVQKFAVKDDIFTNISRGDFVSNRSYKASGVYYLKYSGVESQTIIDSMFEMYSELISSATEKYNRSAGEKGTLNISTLARGANNFEDDFKKMMNDYFKSYFNSKNAVLPLFEGYSYNPVTTSGKQYSNDVSDFKTLVEEALARSAQAFRVPPAIIKGDVANIDSAYSVMLTDCIEPIALAVSQELTRKQFSLEQIANGSAIKADTKRIKHNDIIEMATGIDKLVASSVLSPDEARSELGLVPTGEEWAKKHIMTKNYTSAENAVKGESP